MDTKTAWNCYDITDYSNKHVYFYVRSVSANNCMSLKSVPLSVASKKPQQLTSDQIDKIIHLLK